MEQRHQIPDPNQPADDNQADHKLGAEGAPEKHDKKRWIIVAAGLALALVTAVAVIVLSAQSTHRAKPPTQSWRVTDGNTDFIRGAHSSVNSDFNQYMVDNLPDDYFRYLRDLNANWVGISVALFVDNSLDATVERNYDKGALYTYRDEELRALIRKLREHGFHVYLTLAFEDAGVSGNHPFHRSEFGTPDPNRTDWPWNKDYPGHAKYVKQFWQTYTDQAVHFANIAQDEGVELYSLGTETEGLFRTRVSPTQKGAFLPELTTMVKKVKSAYKGQLTYDMLEVALDGRVEGADLSTYLWQDVDFDVIGISAYFDVLGKLPTTVTPVADMQKAWGRIFEQYLIPLQKRYPKLPIVFTEYENKTGRYVGYDGPLIDTMPPENSNLLERPKVDTNHSGVDDGLEQQANFHQGFFNAVHKYPGVVDGVFAWGEDYWISAGNNSDSYWDQEGSHNKPAAKIFTGEYAKLRQTAE